MSLRREIEKLEDLKDRAKKVKLKIDFVYIAWQSRDYFGVGPTNIKDFQKHVDNNSDDKCKVALLYTIEEVEAFILSREMI